MAERRKNQRFKVTEDFITVHSNNIGFAQDVSLGGMCCVCMNNEVAPEPHGMIDFRSLDKEFYIPNIFVEVLSSKLENEGNFSSFLKRKCHLKFHSLSDQQAAELADFIVKTSRSDSDQQSSE